MHRPPPVFIVGCPRSGTTLLRLMLDSHPSFAVPGETHFIPALAPGSRRNRKDLPPAAVVGRIIAHPRFPALEMTAEEARQVVVTAGATSYAEVIEALMAHYAAVRSKPRWAEKTPGYVRHITRLEALFPDARFVHIIRDGREVAASLTEQPWGTRNAVSGAYWWRTHVSDGRRQGAALAAGRYYEMRQEKLASEPEQTLRALCRFLDEPYDPSMLEYPERVSTMAWPAAAARRVRDRGTNLTKPPTPGLRDWRASVPRRLQPQVEAVCAPLLAELGYPVPDLPRGARLAAAVTRGLDMVVGAPGLVRDRWAGDA